MTALDPIISTHKKKFQCEYIWICSSIQNIGVSSTCDILEVRRTTFNVH